MFEILRTNQKTDETSNPSFIIPKDMEFQADQYDLMRASEMPTPRATDENSLSFPLIPQTRVDLVGSFGISFLLEVVGVGSYGHVTS
jgi:hypothetical protein